MSKLYRLLVKVRVSQKLEDVLKSPKQVNFPKIINPKKTETLKKNFEIADYQEDSIKDTEDNNKVGNVNSTEAEEMNRVRICDYDERGSVIPEVIETCDCSTKVQKVNVLLNAWHKKSHKRIFYSDWDFGNCFSEEGMTVQLHEGKVSENIKVLQNTLVVKDF